MHNQHSYKINFHRIAAAMLLLAFLFGLGCIAPSHADAATVAQKNAAAHKAFKKQMDRDVILTNMGVSYKFIDLNGDKVDECIVMTGIEAAGDFIYRYSGGKVKKICTIGHADYTKFYKRSKVVRVDYGHQGYNSTSYLKIGKKSVKTLCEDSWCTWDYETGAYIDNPEHTYTIKGKAATASAYKACVKKNTKGKSYKLASKCKAYKPATSKSKAKAFLKKYMKYGTNVYCKWSDATNIDYVTGTCYYNGKSFISIRGTHKYDDHDACVFWYAVFPDGEIQTYWSVVA